MRRTGFALGAGLLALVLAASTPGPARAEPSHAATQRASKVLVFAVPRLTWADIRRERPPALLQLLEGAAVASMSHRTIGPHTSSGEGYVTIGAGNRGTVDDLTAGLALAPDEPFESTDAADAFTRRTATSASGAAALHIAMPSVVYQNHRLLYGAEPGTLGESLADAGRSIAVIANADTSVAPGALDLHREAALAGIDRAGQVAGGALADLLTADIAAPFGVRLDPQAVDVAFRDAWANHDVVIVEASDLERADAYAGVSTHRAGAEARRRAIAAADAQLRRALLAVDLQRDLVIVISPAAPRAREQIGVAAVRGPAFDGGWLRSATTRRDRFVTLPDVGPTVLAALGVDRPEAMTGSLFRQGGGRPELAPAMERLIDDSVITTFRDKATGPVSVAFIVFQVLVYALAVVALRWAPRLRTPVAVCALATLAIPIVAFLSGLVRYDRLGIGPYLGVLLLGALVLAGIARAVGGRHPVLPPLILIAGVLTLLLVDAATGGRLQLNTVFGYSPVVAGRFAGYGNLAAALLATSAIVVVSGAWSMLRLGAHRHGLRVAEGGEDGRRQTAAAAAVALLLLLVVVFIGSPSLGSDVGGVLTTVPAFAVVVLLLAGVRISWRVIALLVVATVVVIGGFTALDLARPEADQTHLARLAQRATGSGEGGGATTILRRKANANLAILTSSVWTYLIPAALAFLTFLVWRPRGFLQQLQRRVPGLRAGLIGALIAGILGFSLNDSGVAVPAMMFAVLLPYLTYLLVAPSSPVDAIPVARQGDTRAAQHSAAGR